MIVYPGSPDVRPTDPVTSHQARDTALPDGRVARLIEAAFESAGRPLVADEVHRIITTELGGMCSPERVRTVLANNAGRGWVRLAEMGKSHRGNPSHLWELRPWE